MIPEARPDLLECLRQLKLDEAAIPALRDVAASYRAAIAPQFVELSHERGKAIGESAMLMAEFEIIRAHPGGGAIADAVFERREQLLRKQAQALKRLSETNRAHLRRLVEALPPESADRLEECYLLISYPELYPDAKSQRDAFRKAKSLEVTTDQRAALAGIESEFNGAYAAIARRAHKLLTERAEILEVGGRMYVNQINTFTESQAQLLAERDELNARTRRQLEEMLTAAQVIAISADKKAAAIQRP